MGCHLQKGGCVSKGLVVFIFSFVWANKISDFNKPMCWPFFVYGYLLYYLWPCTLLKVKVQDGFLSRFLLLSVTPLETFTITSYSRKWQKSFLMKTHRTKPDQGCNPSTFYLELHLTCFPLFAAESQHHISWHNWRANTGMQNLLDHVQARKWPYSAHTISSSSRGTWPCFRIKYHSE